jgi:hypothetical protein
LTSAKWLLLERDKHKDMLYENDVSSMSELKTYVGTKEKLGRFDKMWKMLVTEAEKKPQSIL